MSGLRSAVATSQSTEWSRRLRIFLFVHIIGGKLKGKLEVYEEVGVSCFLLIKFINSLIKPYTIRRSNKRLTFPKG